MRGWGEREQRLSERLPSPGSGSRPWELDRKAFPGHPALQSQRLWGRGWLCLDQASSAVTPGRLELTEAFPGALA